MTTTSFLDALRAADRTVARERQQRLAAIDLTEAQAHILRVIADNAAINLNDLSEALPTDAPPSRVVSALVSRRLVSRRDKADDRRHVELTLTKAGRKKADAVRRVEASVARWAQRRLKQAPLASAQKALTALIHES